MPSFNIHLAIAKLYAKRARVKDLTAFYKGTVDPDLTDNKDKTHYGVPFDHYENAWVRFGNKVNLTKFLMHNTVDGDYGLGKFLHLVVDKKFFEEFFGKERLLQEDDNKFRADLYYSYGVLNPYLIKRYNLNDICIDKTYMDNRIQQTSDWANSVKRNLNYTPKCIIGVKRLDEFICEMADVDLESIIHLYDT